MSDVTGIVRKYFNAYPDNSITKRFLRRLNHNNLSRDENPKDHFCVYFAAYDPEAMEVFIGHHKKSGLWLFNGGHLDQGESPEQTMIREIGEEWGVPVDPARITGPSLFTVTLIPSTQKVPCRTHYDIWYFIKVAKTAFHPDPALLATEFYENRWTSLKDVLGIVTDPNTHIAMKFIERSFFI